MKIYIITYNRTRNYGGILQAYGLYRYLELQNYDVSFIDYFPRRCNINNRKIFVEEITFKSKIWGKNRLTKGIFSIYRYPKIKKTFAPFFDFINRRTKCTRPYYSIEELSQDTPIADVFITGSDQVWNSQFSKEQKIDFPFYLSFVKEGKKISYASSFGRDSIPDEHKDIVKKLIEDYSFVSVREQSGRRILSDLSIEATVVVDPTVLCPIEEWINIASSQILCNYILIYQVNFDSRIYKLAKSIASKNDKKLITISLDNRDKKKVREGLVVTPSIEDWLSYIKYADGIITDSFHASVFSILFNRQFIVNSSTRKGMSTRISNLLVSMGLEKRNINCFDSDGAQKILYSNIDWSVCQLKLEKMRNESIKWLRNAIEN